MRHPAPQTYLDFGAPDEARTLDTVDPHQLPGQTTFDLTDTSRVLSIIGDGTTATL